MLKTSNQSVKTTDSLKSNEVKPTVAFKTGSSGKIETGSQTKSETSKAELEKSVSDTKTQLAKEVISESDAGKLAEAAVDILEKAEQKMRDRSTFDMHDENTTIIEEFLKSYSEILAVPPEAETKSEDLSIVTTQSTWEGNAPTSPGNRLVELVEKATTESFPDINGEIIDVQSEIGINEHTIFNEEPPPPIQHMEEPLDQDVIFAENKRRTRRSTLLEVDGVTTLVLEDVSEETAEEVEPEVEELIDRVDLYEKFVRLNKKLNWEKMKNSLLQKKMIAYYKKKKMDHVFKESDVLVQEDVDKYVKRLDGYLQLRQVFHSETQTLSQDLRALNDETRKKRVEIQRLFAKLRNREKDVGSGLICTSTGSRLAEPVIERLLNRQKQQTDLMSTMRLNLIKLQHKINELVNKLKALDTIGGNFRLLYYEELKLDQYNFKEKNEEREDELERLRSRCKRTLSIMAHVKEKLGGNKRRMDILTNRLSVLSTNYAEVREKVNTMRNARSRLRSKSLRLVDAMNMNRSILLRDMQDAMDERVMKAQLLKELTEETKLKEVQIRNVRKVIEKAMSEKKMRMLL